MKSNSANSEQNQNEEINEQEENEKEYIDSLVKGKVKVSSHTAQNNLFLIEDQNDLG